MAKLNDLDIPVELGAGEFVTGVFDPAADVKTKTSTKFGSERTTYEFRIRLEDGQFGVVSGGSRLLRAMRNLRATGPMHVKVTAIGDAGTSDRNWAVEPFDKV